jgi:hypothetical protein
MYLIIIVNDESIVPKGFAHGSRYNIILMVIMLAVSLIGVSNIDKSVSASLDLQQPSHPLAVLGVTLLIMVYPLYVLYMKYKD